jgi:myo-inositol-1(or 4)-monophosphatase
VDDSQRLEIAIRAARAGGQVLLEHAGNPLYFRLKGRRDLFVGAAQVAQDAIRDLLRGECPEDAFLGEEGPDDEELPIGAERLWIVDPLDGTTNFFRGVPAYAISLAFRDATGIRVGVVFDPLHEELYAARMGGGALLNGRPIFVHIAGEGEDAYEGSLIGTDLPGETEARVQALRAATHVGNRMMGLLMLGSPSLGLCYVAAGRTHAYFHVRLQVWDVAAAAIILQEAGGTLTSASGGSWLYSAGDYLASNGRLHGGMLRLLRAALPELGQASSSDEARPG